MVREEFIEHEERCAELVLPPNPPRSALRKCPRRRCLLRLTIVVMSPHTQSGSRGFAVICQGDAQAPSDGRDSTVAIWLVHYEVATQHMIQRFYEGSDIHGHPACRVSLLFDTRFAHASACAYPILPCADIYLR